MQTVVIVVIETCRLLLKCAESIRQAIHCKHIHPAEQHRAPIGVTGGHKSHRHNPTHTDRKRKGDERERVRAKEGHSNPNISTETRTHH